MTIRRERDLERICLSALERPTAERAAFLIDACGCDEELRRETELRSSTFGTFSVELSSCHVLG
jgi:hypothetical protein